MILNLFRDNYNVKSFNKLFKLSKSFKVNI